MNIHQISKLIPYPKFWLWGELFFIRPWYGDGLLFRVDSENPEYSLISGEFNENDIWYSDPFGGGS